VNEPQADRRYDAGGPESVSSALLLTLKEARQAAKDAADKPAERDGEKDAEEATKKAAYDAAWERLVNLYQPEVYRWCRIAHLRPDDAEDVCQDVFRRVIQYIPSFSRAMPGQSFGGWLYTITQSKIADYFRFRRQEPPGRGGSTAHHLLQQAPQAEDPSSSMQLDPNSLGIQQALARIRPDFTDHVWESFRRMVFDGHGAADIARELGMNKKSVREAKYRVCQRLRKELDVQRPPPV
jgi:RNA polymerase sigma-70 factor (ECF subfamily)